MSPAPTLASNIRCQGHASIITIFVLGGFRLIQDRCCSLTNHVQYKLWLRQHGYVTASNLEGCCTHALCYKALQVGLNRMIFGGDYVPAGLRLPSRPGYLLVKQVSDGRRMSCPNQLLLFFRKITRKG